MPTLQEDTAGIVKVSEADMFVQSVLIKWRERWIDKKTKALRKVLQRSLSKD